MDGQSVHDADPYDQALRNSAGRLAYHAHVQILHDGLDPAGMLREAALLLDLLREREIARSVARGTRKPRVLH